MVARNVNILVPNLGSTSLKYQLLEMPAERVLARGKLERVQDYHEAITQIDTSGAEIDAVAFKAVHGGPRYRGTCLVDEGVLEALAAVPPRGSRAQCHLYHRASAHSSQP